MYQQTIPQYSKIDALTSELSQLFTTKHQHWKDALAKSSGDNIVETAQKIICENPNYHKDFSNLIETLKGIAGLSSDISNRGLEKEEIKDLLRNTKKNQLKLKQLQKFFSDVTKNLDRDLSLLINFTTEDDAYKAQIEAFFIDLFEIFKRLEHFSENQDPSLRLIFANFARRVQRGLTRLYLDRQDFASAKTSLMEAERYQNIVNRLQNSLNKKNKTSEFNWVYEKRWDEELLIRTCFNLTYSARILIGEKNLKDAELHCRKIVSIIDSFKEMNSNYVPLDVIDLFPGFCLLLEEKNEIEKALYFYQLTERYCTQMLDKNIKALGLTTDSDYSADHPDLQEKRRISSKKIIELAISFIPYFLEKIPAIKGIEIKISGFNLVFNIEKICEKDKEKLCKMLKAYLDKDNLIVSENEITIKGYFKLQTVTLSKIVSDFEEYRQKVNKPITQKVVDTKKENHFNPPSSYTMIHECLSNKPSKVSKKKGKNKRQANNNNNANSNIIPEAPLRPIHEISEEEKAEIRETLGHNNDIFPIINDSTGTQLLIANWNKIKQDQLAHRITPAIENKFKNLFSQGRTVGDYGSGLKHVKGNYRKEGFFLKGKVGEDIEIFARRKNVKTTTGRTFSVFEFDTLVDHKMQKNF